MTASSAIVPAPLSLYVKLVLTAALWGGQFIAGRVVAQVLPHFTASVLRFGVAAVVLLVLVRMREGGLPRLDARQWLAMIVLGATGVSLYNAFFFAALEHVPAGRASLIMALNPVGTALGAWLLFRERMSPLRCVGIVLSLIGAAVVIGRGDPLALLSGALGAGELMLFVCVLSWVAYTLTGRVVLGRVSVLATTAYAALVGTAMLAVGAAFELPQVRFDALSPSDWGAVVYLGVLGTVVAFLWYNEGVLRLGPARAAVFINFVPVFGVVFSAILLAEPVLPSMIVGGALVIIGVSLTNRASSSAA